RHRERDSALERFLQGSAVADRHREAGGCRACRGVPRVAISEVHYRRKSGSRRHDTRPRLAILFAALLAASVGRFMSLDHRPMQADEGVLADKFGSFLDTGRYSYDPREHHGPVLAYATWLSARLTGHTTYPSLTEQTLRFVPAIAGVLVVLSPLLLAR